MQQWLTLLGGNVYCMLAQPQRTGTSRKQGGGTGAYWVKILNALRPTRCHQRGYQDQKCISFNMTQTLLYAPLRPSFIATAL